MTGAASVTRNNTHAGNVSDGGTGGQATTATATHAVKRAVGGRSGKQGLQFSQVRPWDRFYMAVDGLEYVHFGKLRL